MSIVISVPHDIRSLTDYIAHCNSQIERHIGFCGENSDAILSEIENDFSDLSSKDSFLVAYEDYEIVGVIGLDIDLEDNSAEVWGPFINDNNLKLANKMWTEVLLKVPSEISNFKFFINTQNVFVESFLNNIGANFFGTYSLLNIEKKKFNSINLRKTVNINHLHINSFIDLHDTVFAGAYYNARNILSRQNKNNKLLILPKNNTDIEGYVYIENTPEYHEADIEFIAVHPDARGKGLSKILLHNALQTIFDYPEINNVTLTVSHENIVALNLYKSAEFQEIYILNYFIYNRG